MNIPNENTFKVLEGRKKYLITKNENNGGRNGYIQAEIKALDRILTFTKLILSNFSNESIKKIITENELEHTDAVINR